MNRLKSRAGRVNRLKGIIDNSDVREAFLAIFDRATRIVAQVPNEKDKLWQSEQKGSHYPVLGRQSEEPRRAAVTAVMKKLMEQGTTEGSARSMAMKIESTVIGKELVSLVQGWKETYVPLNKEFYTITGVQLNQAEQLQAIEALRQEIGLSALHKT